MAITIGSVPTLKDNPVTYSIPFSGRETNGSNGYVVGDILIHGTVIASAISTSATTSILVTFTGSSADVLYNALNGKTRTDAIVFRVREYSGGIETPPVLLNTSTATRTFLTSSITKKLTNASWSTMANPWDLDNITNVRASWLRPHSAFRGRVRVYVNEILIITRTSLATDVSYSPSSAEISSAISAMGGVSPRSLRINITTQFNFNTVQTVETTGINLDDRPAGVIKSFMTFPIKVWDGAAWVAKAVKVWTGSLWSSKDVKRWNGSNWVDL